MIQEYVSDGIKMRGEIEIMKIKGNNSFFKYLFRNDYSNPSFHPLSLWMQKEKF